MPCSPGEMQHAMPIVLIDPCHSLVSLQVGAGEVRGGQDAVWSPLCRHCTCMIIGLSCSGCAYLTSPHMYQAFADCSAGGNNLCI